MTEEGRREAAGEELARAREELTAATRLLEIEMPRVAMTRIYFACFHAVRALLYREDLAPRSHGGVLQLFNLHFVKTGRYEPAAAHLVARLQKYRQEADYATGFVVDEAVAREELVIAGSFVERIARESG